MGKCKICDFCGIVYCPDTVGMNRVYRQSKACECSKNNPTLIVLLTLYFPYNFCTEHAHDNFSLSALEFLCVFQQSINLYLFFYLHFSTSHSKTVQLVTQKGCLLTYKCSKLLTLGGNSLCLSIVYPNVYNIKHVIHWSVSRKYLQ